MSKFSGINAPLMKNSADTALRELQRYSLSGEISNLSNKNILNSHACKVIDSLKKVQDSEINGCISNLKKHLNNLSSAAYYITMYQDAEKKVDALKLRLYYYDDKGVMYIDYNVQEQIRRLNEAMLSYERTIEYHLSDTSRNTNSSQANSATRNGGNTTEQVN